MLVERFASFEVREAQPHDLTREFIQFRQDLLQSAVLGDGLIEPVSLIFGQCQTDGLGFHFG